MFAIKSNIVCKKKKQQKKYQLGFVCYSFAFTPNKTKILKVNNQNVLATEA
jgi:hypothetical protein